MAPPPRIVSLLPACTEIACALGLESCLIGRSHECDFPPSVAGVLVCTAPRIDVHLSSGGLDREVRRSLAEGLSLFEVDFERIGSLEPDFILTQAHCEVCAVSAAELGEWAARELKRPVRLISYSPSSLTEVWGGIAEIADELGVSGQGAALLGRLRNRLETVRQQTSSLAPRPTLLGIEWIEPLFGAGNWIPELIETAGGRSAFGEPGKHSPGLDWETLCQIDPDVVAIFPCGFGLDRAVADAAEQGPRWRALRAARENRIGVADGNQFFNRPGPRLVESTEILAEMLHPGHCRFGHKGVAWVPL